MNTIEEITLPTEAFSIDKLQDFYYRGNIKKNFTEVVQYINRYYFETSKGQYIYYNYREYEDNQTKGTFELRSSDEFRKEVLYKVDSNKAIIDEIKMNSKRHELISNVFYPRCYKKNNQYYINECAGLLHKNYKHFDEYDESIKNKVQMIIDMIEEISCYGKKDMLEAYLKYLATICRGKKSEVIIYKKSGEGYGKSTETDFLINYVFGKDICLISGSEPLISNFNKIFMGKLFVVFEELPTFSKEQWKGVSSKLKTLTTEKMSVFRDLFEKPFQASNLLNFQINTNVEALKDSQGRRIMIMDINPSRIKDFNFFGNIRKQCFNIEVGEAFYSYLMTKITDEDIDNFYAQRDFPETRNKLLAVSNQLDSAYKFLKFEYYLKNKSIDKIPCKDLYDNYLSFCDSNKIGYKHGRNQFYEVLLNIKIERRDIKKIPFYKVPFDHLKQIAERDKWICEYDEFEGDEEKEDSPLNKLYPVLDTKDKDDEIELLKQKILQLEEHIKNLNQTKVEEIKPEIKKETSKKTKKEIKKDEEEIIDETEDENEGLLSLKDHIKKIKDEEGITTIAKPKYVEEIITKKSKPKKEKEETVKKGSNQKTKKKYNETITEIFNCENVKEMDEIDF